MERLLSDLRLAVRVWRARPLLASVILLTLGAGVSALTAVASVVHAVLLAPLPYGQPDRLAVVRAALPGQGQTVAQISGPEFAMLAERARTVRNVGAVWARPGVVGRGDAAVEIEVGWITADFLETFAVAPQIGRLPTIEEYRRNDVIVLSDGLWRQRYGRDPSIVGRRIDFDEEPRTVLGVMPPRFRMIFAPDDGVPESVQAWLPWGSDPAELPRPLRVFTVVARLADGAAIGAVDHELRSIAAAIGRESVDYARSGFELTAAPLGEAVVARVRPTLLVVVGVVVLVFAIACANVANLLLSRAMERSPEFAVRLALGAGVARVWRQIMTESALLGCLGAALGVAFAAAGVAMLRQLDPAGIPRIQDAAIEPATLLAAAGAAIVAALFFGWVAGRQALNAPRHLSTRGASQRTGIAHRLFVVTQLSLSVVLLCGAGLLVRSVVELNRLDLGFSPDRVLSLRLSLPDVRYSYTTAGENIGEFYRRLDERLAQLPGVRAAGSTISPPLSDLPVRPRPYAYRSNGSETEWGSLVANYRTVTPGWFDAIGARLLSGRFLDSRDRWDQPIAIVVDATLAAKAWPKHDAIGQALGIELFRNGAFERHWGTVVGVVAPIRLNSMVAAEREQIFIAHHQAPQRTMYPAIRADGDPLAVVSASRSVVRSLEADLPVFDVRLASDYVADATAQTRFAMLVLSLFATLAILLAAGGVFAAMAASVGRRRREIGVRLAVGASPASVFRWTMMQGLGWTMVGVAAGLIGAGALTRFLSTLLFGVDPIDPATMGGVSLLVSASATAACAVPAARAARVDPCVTLRAE
jgi:putative ABC transport system permease protein